MESKAIDACGADYLDEVYEGDEDDDLFDDGLPDPDDYLEPDPFDEAGDDSSFFVGGPDPYESMSAENYEDEDDQIFAEWYQDAPNEVATRQASNQSRTASKKGTTQRPKPRTQPNGANNLAPVRTASKVDKEDISLFDCAPVVSKFF